MVDWAQPQRTMGVVCRKSEKNRFFLSRNHMKHVTFWVFMSGSMFWLEGNRFFSIFLAKTSNNIFDKGK